ncbi:helix-turn-helix domain-containing protein [Lachnospiraceae bacterium OttesenSCG-928-E19]|nr:helix-turn-helix domain-containing protein [Lachnospiraceae bacterium OttesenSCG-928-E19]
MNRQLISEKILHIRNLRNMSREELAERADLSVSYLYQLESGRKNIGLSALMKVAGAL